MVRMRGAAADDDAAAVGADGQPLGALAAARAVFLGNLHHQAILRLCLGVDDLNLADERAQTQRLEVKLDHREQVLIVVAVAVAIEVGGVLVSLLVRQLVAAELVGHPVRPGGQRHNLRAARVHREKLQHVATAVLAVNLSGVDRLEHLRDGRDGEEGKGNEWGRQSTESRGGGERDVVG